jgi:hypothetical protein
MSGPSPARSLLLGMADVIRAPLLVLAVALITLLVAVPFAGVLHSRLQASLSVQPHVNLDETEIDPEWWMEFRDHASGLEATFTPAVLGFAATLDGISNVLDGNGIPLALAAPLGLSILAWAFLWGAILSRFNNRAGFVSGGRAYFVRFVIVAVVAAAANLILYLTVHRLLFGPVHTWLTGMTGTERDAFFVRVFLYLIFFSMIAMVSLIADYARVAAVTAGASSFGGMMRASIAFVRLRAGAVITLFMLTGLIFVIATIAYGSLEVVGGSEVGGWRAVAIGQAYVLVRLAIRLTFASSELRLFNANQTAAAE